MIDVDTFIREQLSEIDPLPSMLTGDWKDVLTRVQRPTEARLRLRGGRRLRIAVAIAVLALAGAIPAIGYADGWFTADIPTIPPIGPAVTPLVDIPGVLDGIPLQMNGHLTSRDGLCLEASGGGSCGREVIGEPTGLYSQQNTQTYWHWVGGAPTESVGDRWLTFAPVAKVVQTVSIQLKSGNMVRATIFPVPERLGVDLSISAAFVPDYRSDPIVKVVGRSADGTVLEAVHEFDGSPVLSVSTIASGKSVDVEGYVSQKVHSLDLSLGDGTTQDVAIKNRHLPGAPFFFSTAPIPPAKFPLRIVARSAQGEIIDTVVVDSP